MKGDILMYRIHTDIVRMYSDLIKKSYRQGDPRTASCFLDLEEGFLYFRLSNVYEGRLRLHVEEKDSSPHGGTTAFWVNIPTFLSLCNEYPHIDYDTEEYTFFHGSETFRLSLLEEDFDKRDFQSFHDDDSVNKVQFDATTEEFARIVKAFGFAGRNGDNGKNYAGTALIGDQVAAGNISDAYCGKTGTDIGPTPVLLPEESLPLFQEAQKRGNLNLYIYESWLYATVNESENELVVYLSQSTNLHYPRVNEEDFVSKYNHDTFLSIDRARLMDVLRFFQDFQRGNVDDSYVDLEIMLNENSEYVLVLSSKGDSNEGSRNVPLEGVDDELVEGTFTMIRASLLKAVSSLPGERIRLRLDSQGVAYSAQDDDDPEAETIVMIAVVG